MEEVAPYHLCLAYKGEPDKIWPTHLKEGQWSSPVEIRKANKGEVWNPVLCKVQDELLLFYRVGVSLRDVVAYVMRSKDEGLMTSQQLVGSIFRCY